MVVDLLSSLFKYPGQTAPVKISLINAQVRPAKPAMREKGKKRRENSSRGKIFCREREGEGERRAGERGGVLLTTEAIYMVRRPEEREKDNERERKRDEKEGEETFLLSHLLATEAISVARRREEREDVRGRKKGLLPAIPSRRK